METVEQNTCIHDSKDSKNSDNAIDDQACEKAKPYNRKKIVQKQSSLSSWEDLDDDHSDDNRHSFEEIPNNLEQRDSKEDLDSSSICVSTQKDIKAQSSKLNIKFNIKNSLLILATLCSILSLLISINTYLRFSRYEIKHRSEINNQETWRNQIETMIKSSLSGFKQEVQQEMKILKNDLQTTFENKIQKTTTELQTDVAKKLDEFRTDFQKDENLLKTDVSNQTSEVSQDLKNSNDKTQQPERRLEQIREEDVMTYSG